MISSTQSLKILLVAAEAAPFAKVGGLADVAGALPKSLHRLGHDIRVVMPRYARINPDTYHLTTVQESLSVPLGQGQEQVRVLQGTLDGEVPVYFIEAPRFFERENIYGYYDDDARFILFCRATLEWVKQLHWSPDIVHTNDWHTAIIPNWLRTLYRQDPLFMESASLFTIHNLAYQGIFGEQFLDLAGIRQEWLVYPGWVDIDYAVNLMGRGIFYSDAVNTVSETYANEILTPEFGERLDPLLRQRRERLFGILNGIDAEEFNPQTDPHIPVQFSTESLSRRVENKFALQREARLPVDATIPLLAMITRLAGQKGLDLLEGIGETLLRQNLQLVVLGSGEPHYEEMLKQLAIRYPDRVSVFLMFNVPLAQRIYAGSDIFVMPSRFEPCGLGQMIALRYGSIPVVRSTGGLADTVEEYDPRSTTGNGFTFTPYTTWDLFAALIRATQAFKYKTNWQDLMAVAMAANHSWDLSAQKYVELYHKARELHSSWPPG